MTALLETVAPLAEPTPEEVIAVAAELFGVGPSRLTGRDLRRPLVRYRVVAMAATRLATTCSYPSIGRAFDGRDHTTVFSACRRVAHIPLLLNSAHRIVEEVRRRREGLLEEL